MPVHSFTAAPLEILRQVEAEIWERWGIAAERHAVVGLAQVSAFFEAHRVAWEETRRSRV
jgi:hypothetical protein